MNIASVVVDVPAKQTDRSFDYLIPDEWIETIQPGMRVIVPFGPGKIQGFVTEIKAESEFKKLREISEPMDLEPVLNEELLELGNWLTENTLCFKIYAYQAMLPAALKAKYEKKVMLSSDVKVQELPAQLHEVFYNKDTITWDEAMKKGLVPILQKEASKGNLEVIYLVKGKLNKKKLKFVSPLRSSADLEAELNSLPQRAEKQKEVLRYFVLNPEPVELRHLLAGLNISAATVKALVEKELLVEQLMEVYRDPYENRTFTRTEPLPLTDDQQSAIIPILASIENKLHEVFLLYGVTGSGKTEIYLQSIQEVIEKGREAIVLVPEIAFTPQMVNRFKGRFGNLVAVMHSGLSAGEKYDEWRKIQRKEVKVVVGARSAIFAPFENLGIIIIDEEHETSYKQEDNAAISCKRGGN